LRKKKKPHRKEIIIMSEMQRVLEERLLYAPVDMYGIYQLKRCDELHHHRFTGTTELKKLELTIERGNYQLRYITTLEPDMNENTIFNLLNINHPEDYNTASLSISDVIVFQRRGQITVLYVDADDKGFTELNGFLDVKPSACSICGAEYHGDGDHCSRCAMLSLMFDGEFSMERLLMDLWYCPDCGSQIVGGVRLTEENLEVTCDECGEEHIIPFTVQNIARYVRAGIKRESDPEDDFFPAED